MKTIFDTISDEGQSIPSAVKRDLIASSKTASDYGAWIVPSGKVYPVHDFQGHAKVLGEIFKSFTDLEPTDEEALRSGFVRVVYHPLTIELGRATPRQKEKLIDLVFNNATPHVQIALNHKWYELDKKEDIDKIEGLIRAASSKTAVSRLPNDVMEKVDDEEYPQEYMSPSPSGMGSVRPGDDPILTGSYKLPDAEAIPTPDQLPQPKKKIAVKDKDHYRYDPGHRQKPYGPGWRPTQSGWSKPRPGSNTVPEPLTEPITQYTKPSGVLGTIPQQPVQPAVASELLKIAREIMADSDDDEYLNAVKGRDVSGAIKMIETAAKRAGYKLGPVWHGTHAPKPFVVFNTRRSTGDGRMGAYFSDNKDYASRPHALPAKTVYASFLRMNKPLDLTRVQREDIAQAAGLGQDAQFDTRTQGAAGPYATLEWLDKKYNLIPKLKKRGYDGIIFDGFNEGATYVVFNPSSIKSADVSVDDAGNVIPLSKRFNSGNDDIRF